MASFSFSLITLIVFETVDRLIIIPRYVLFFNGGKKKKTYRKHWLITVESCLFSSSCLITWERNRYRDVRNRSRADLLLSWCATWTHYGVRYSDAVSSEAFLRASGFEWTAGGSWTGTKQEVVIKRWRWICFSRRRRLFERFKGFLVWFLSTSGMWINCL